MKQGHHDVKNIIDESECVQQKDNLNDTKPQFDIYRDKKIHRKTIQANQLTLFKKNRSSISSS